MYSQMYLQEQGPSTPGRYRKQDRTPTVSGVRYRHSLSVDAELCGVQALTSQPPPKSDDSLP